MKPHFRALVTFGFFLGVDLSSVAHGRCGDIDFATELMSRTACYENNEDACAIINFSHLFKEPSQFILFASVEKLPAKRIKGISRSQVDIGRMHELVKKYNHNMINHKILTQHSDKPGQFVRQIVEGKLKPDPNDTQTVRDEKVNEAVKNFGSEIAKDYQRETLNARQQIYQLLGFKAEGKEFERVGEVDDFMRAWRNARERSKTPDKTFDPDANKSVRAAWRKMLGKHGNPILRPLPKISRSGSMQNAALGFYEAMDQGNIKKADIRRASCPSGSFNDYDSLKPPELKNLFDDNGCRAWASTDYLETLFSEHTARLEEDPLCQILERQIKTLREKQFNEPYRDIEVPQRPDAQSVPGEQ